MPLLQNVYKGESPVDSVYKGSSLVWERDDGELEVAGASLPITYDLSSLTGTIRYVATNGNDSNTGTSISAPKATLASAVSASSAGQNIVVRGGVYRNQRNVSIGSRAGLTIIAYPGEVPVFNGAVVADTGWNVEGSLRWRSYVPRPVQSGLGVDLPNNQNLTASTGYVGKHPDQAWVGDLQLRQVLTIGEVNDTTFYVDFNNQRLYVTENNVNQGGIETSRSYDGTRDRMLFIQSSGVTIEGIVFTRYSANLSDVAVIVVNANYHNITFRHVVVSECSHIAMQAGFSDNSLWEHVTISGSNWMGLTLNQCDASVMRYIDWQDINKWDQFTSSPMSGALKTSRCRGSVVEYCVADNCRGNTIWFDQSNINIVIANNRITNQRTGAGVYFEISERLKLVNNYIQSVGTREPVQLSGSSECTVVNNTLVGGANPLAVYTDSRSREGCADGSAQCGTWWQSDVQTRFPTEDTMDWMPRVSLCINNIMAYPTTVRFLGVLTTVAFMTTNADATQPIEKMLHQDDEPWPGLTRTIWDSNVYANGSGALVRVSSPSATYNSTTAFNTAMAGSPVLLSGIDSNSLHGNIYVNSDGSPTSTLLAQSSSAYPVPVDATINKYVPAGTQHHGVL
jgi:hypothetical protein